MKEEQEIWKDIEDFEGLYKISSLGRVMSLRKGKERILISNPKKGNYAIVCLCKKDFELTINIHRIVAKHFVLNPDKKKIVNHKDGNKHNNAAKNLEWCTMQENAWHARDMGLTPIGQDVVFSKYKDWQIKQVKGLLSLGHLNLEIAALTGIPRHTITKIKMNKEWTHIKPNIQILNAPDAI